MGEMSQELMEVKEEFTKWRATRTSKQSVPEYLWQKAASLLNKHSPSLISKHLGVDYNYLKILYSQSVAENGSFREIHSSKMTNHLSSLPLAVAVVQTPETSLTSAKSSSSPTFLEVSAKDIDFSHSNIKLNNNCSQTTDNKQLNTRVEQHTEPKIEPTTPQTCQLVFERKDGVKLSMSLPLDWTNLSLFCSNLLKG